MQQQVVGADHEEDADRGAEQQEVVLPHPVLAARGGRPRTNSVDHGERADGEQLEEGAEAGRSRTMREGGLRHVLAAIAPAGEVPLHWPSRKPPRHGQPGEHQRTRCWRESRPFFRRSHTSATRATTSLRTISGAIRPGLTRGMRSRGFAQTQPPSEPDRGSRRSDCIQSSRYQGAMPRNEAQEQAAAPDRAISRSVDVRVVPCTSRSALPEEHALHGPQQEGRRDHDADHRQHARAP